jgi:hypothetical protein
MPYFKSLMLISGTVDALLDLYEFTILGKRTNIIER